jgi:cyclic beta-1,2-glucan synthetase
VDIDRRHRWIRGDWQITQWLLPRVPGSDARRIANPLSVLSQWKIFDNLRRSLVPVALMLLMLGNWLLLPRTRRPWIAAGRFDHRAPRIVGGAGPACVRKPADLPWAMHLRGAAGSCGRQLGQIFLTLAFLPYDAFISLDAIGRTLLRLLVTHKRLLEWQTSSDSERTTRADLAGFYATMWIAPVIALATDFSGFGMQPAHLSLALPILGLWLAAPWIAWWISQPIESRDSGFDGGAIDVSQTHRPQDLAFFRDLCHRAGKLAAAGQFSGSSRPDDRFADLAHEYGPGVARQSGRPGFGVSFRGRLDSANARHLRHDATTRAPSRALL